MNDSNYSGIPVPALVAQTLEGAVDHENSTFSWTYLCDGTVRMDKEINRKVGKFWTFDSIELSVIGTDDTDVCCKMAELINHRDN